MKPLFTAVVFLLVFCVITCLPAHCLWNPLTEKQIKEAIEYGKNQNNLLYGGEKIDFELSKIVATITEWEQAKGWSRIETPFHALAVAAREKSRKYMELSTLEINAICEKYSGKLVFIQQFGTFYIPVANQFHCIIKKNGEIIQPIAKEVIYNKIYFTFPVKDVDLNSTVRFIFIHADEEQGEKTIIFDFGNIR